MVVANKKFQFSSTFKNVSKLEDGKYLFGTMKMHFNIPWCVSVSHNDDNLAVYLYCSKLRKTDVMWAIDAEIRFSIKTSTGKDYRNKSCQYIYKNTITKINGIGFHSFINWNTLINDYLIDDSVTVEVSVKITDMTGFSKKILKNFDESFEKFSDVIIVVEGQKFFANKKFLACHSTYFEALLLGNFEEAGKPEVTLKDIDPTDFQYLLEVLFGEAAIDDDTIDGVLHLAHMFDVAYAIRKCVEFLVEKSKKSLRDMLKIANKYQLETLKKVYLSKINTADEIKAAMADDLSEMDQAVAHALIQKYIALRIDLPRRS